MTLITYSTLSRHTDEGSKNNSDVNPKKRKKDRDYTGDNRYKDIWSLVFYADEWASQVEAARRRTAKYTVGRQSTNKAGRGRDLGDRRLPLSTLPQGPDGYLRRLRFQA
jgi:hypothetical protein